MGTRVLVAMLAVILLVSPAAASSEFETDMAFALEEIERQCGHFFELEGISWKDVPYKPKAFGWNPK